MTSDMHSKDQRRNVVSLISLGWSPFWSSASSPASDLKTCPSLLAVQLHNSFQTNMLILLPTLSNAYSKTLSRNKLRSAIPTSLVYSNSTLRLRTAFFLSFPSYLYLRAFSAYPEKTGKTMLILKQSLLGAQWAHHQIRAGHCTAMTPPLSKFQHAGPYWKNVLHWRNQCSAPSQHTPFTTRKFSTLLMLAKTWLEHIADQTQFKTHFSTDLKFGRGSFLKFPEHRPHILLE